MSIYFKQTRFLFFFFLQKPENRRAVRPVKTVPGIGGEGIKENGGGSEFNYDILQELLKMSQCNPPQQ
jgi:hypothetical protein